MKSIPSDRRTHSASSTLAGTVFAIGRKAILVAACTAALQSCAAPRDTALMAAVASPSSAGSVMSGPLFLECFKDSPKVVAALEPGAVGRFSPEATYQLAERMKKSPPTIAAYADRVRGYVTRYDSKSIFGTNTADRICYYGETNSGSIYLDNVTADELGGVEKSDMAGAVLEAYRKLSGAKLSFGEEALIIMSVPNY